MSFTPDASFLRVREDDLHPLRHGAMYNHHRSTSDVKSQNYILSTLCMSPIAPYPLLHRGCVLYSLHVLVSSQCEKGGHE